MIKILDCTLRDGGYMNNWYFGDGQIKAIIRALLDSKIEFIECGYLNDSVENSQNRTIYRSIDDPRELIINAGGVGDSSSELFLMANLGDVDVKNLPENTYHDINFAGIRLAFHIKDYDKAIKQTKILSSKGYKVCVQPMVTSFYTEDQLIDLMRKLAEPPVDCFAVYIVDSFGTMDSKEINRLNLLINGWLAAYPHIGFHAHNNMQLAYSNAKYFLNHMRELNERRSDLIVDSSIFGMGRGAGNLNTEIMMDYLMREEGNQYGIDYVLDIIDDIQRMHKKKNWGYSVPHLLSAIRKSHPNYASYLIDKGTLSTAQIKAILDEIPEEKRISFDKKLAEELYLQHRTDLKIVGVIPARYKSSRFPGKPLIDIKGKPMIQRTYEQVCKAEGLDEAVVATDDDRIREACEKASIPVVMTSESCLTGTDRLAEVAEMIDADLYINIQGDEPVISPETISLVIDAYRQHGDDYAAYNLYKDISEFAKVDNDSLIKVIVNENSELVYMSRMAVPYRKDDRRPDFFRQVCVYGFTREALRAFACSSKTCNEKYEDIEILRFIDLGYKVKMIKTDLNSISVDNPEDVKKVEAFLNNAL
jgi:3-deoxy-D-manno-octulosonate cytidylyltransferase